MAEKRIEAKHGTVCYMPEERYGYFGWPTIARMDDGTLVVGASGLRFDHICPWGKTVVLRSVDEGRTWTRPEVVNNTPLDDRDCGVVSLGGGKLLITWFGADIRPHAEWARDTYKLSEDEWGRWEAVFATYTDEMVEKWRCSWIRTSVDGAAWGDFIRAPLNTPHGPIKLTNGELLYFGKRWDSPGSKQAGCIMAARSGDDGLTWEELGMVPLCDGVEHKNFHEPHVVELPSGKLVGLIRYEYENREREQGKYLDFSMFQTESEDGGRTWTPARHLGIYGAPPHLIRHSSGVLVCTYSSRRAPLSEMAMISWDDGATWDDGWIINEAPPRDHGYPASVEMPDGSIFTVYYQRGSDEYKNCGIFWSRWNLPR